MKVLISNQRVLHTDCLFLMSSENTVDWAIPTGTGLSILQIGHSSQIDFVARDVIWEKIIVNSQRLLYFYIDCHTEWAVGYE